MDSIKWKNILQNGNDALLKLWDKSLVAQAVRVTEKIMRKIEIKNICKSFDELDVLQGIDMTVDEGEVVTIIGPSGGGKSTLLRCLNKLETINKGTILIDGETLADTDETGNVTYADDASRITCKMGMVFQQFNLFPHMTVLENLMEAPVQVQKRDPATVRKEAESLLEKVGLLDKKDQYPRRLSGGQQQRVAIARALAADPEIIYFDEPTSALDPELTGEVLRVLRELADRKTTMIIVTHEMHFARDVADRILFMDGGVVVEEGPAKQLIDHPREQRTKQFLAHYAE